MDRIHVKFSLIHEICAKFPNGNWWIIESRTFCLQHIHTKSYGVPGGSHLVEFFNWSKWSNHALFDKRLLLWDALWYIITNISGYGATQNMPPGGHYGH